MGSDFSSARVGGAYDLSLVSQPPNNPVLVERIRDLSKRVDLTIHTASMEKYGAEIHKLLEKNKLSDQDRQIIAPLVAQADATIDRERKWSASVSPGVLNTSDWSAAKGVALMATEAVRQLAAGKFRDFREQRWQVTSFIKNSEWSPEQRQYLENKLKDLDEAEIDFAEKCVLQRKTQADFPIESGQARKDARIERHRVLLEEANALKIVGRYRMKTNSQLKAAIKKAKEREGGAEQIRDLAESALVCKR